ncbi:MAG: hypothetical protein ACW981_01315 [Candidatus Hodarchaeales archaeon]|jgi:hypothetical protein
MTDFGQIKNYPKNSALELIEIPENPVAYTFITETSNKPITIPIWTFFYQNKFYCFAGDKSKKVQSIKSGNTDVSLLIINKSFFPHPESDIIPYLGISGSARICTFSDNPKTAWIHQQLLLKYDPELSQKWIKDLHEKIESKPEEDWLIEIKPQRYYTY